MKKTFLVLLLAFSISVTSFAQLQVPQYIVFGGEKINLDTQDRRERMDREFIAFSNMHTNSILLLKRSSRCFPQIEPILREYGVPDDLKYLCCIESTLDPKAVSSAGAAGLWQFTKAGAKTWGLETGDEVDERYDLRKATVAACKYLKKAHEMYGDWMTAAASYNAGMGGISRKLEDQKADCALDLWLVEETSRYMYRLMACKIFFENPASFGFNVPGWERYPYIAPSEVVTVSGPVESLVDFAIAHGVTYADLKRANLWLRSDHLTNKAGKTYEIVIP